MSRVFLNNGKRHFLFVNDDEIRHGPSESVKPLKNDIKNRKLAGRLNDIIMLQGVTTK